MHAFKPSTSLKLKILHAIFWHKLREPPLRVAHKKLPPRMAAILGVVSGGGSRAFRRRR